MPHSFPILIIDDDASLADIMPQAARDGFPEASFRFISNAQLALDVFAQHQVPLPKLVLLDVNLEDVIDGLQLLSQLRANTRLFMLPIIIMTVNKTAPVVYRAYYNGATSFSPKPFSLQEWKAFFVGLRDYWFVTVSLPPYPKFRCSE